MIRENREKIEEVTLLSFEERRAILAQCFQGAGTASRFAEPQGGGFSGDGAEAAGLPPHFAETMEFRETKRVPGRCFRESRRRPRAQSQLSSQKQSLWFRKKSICCVALQLRRCER
jgi:hypothetical protein